MFPATPFARRRHLFHRMLLISREAVMSSRKIVMSSIVAGVAVAVTAWTAVAAFPLVASAAPEPAAQSQNPPRDRRPGEAGPESATELQLKDTDPRGLDEERSVLRAGGTAGTKGEPGPRPRPRWTRSTARSRPTRRSSPGWRKFTLQPDDSIRLSRCSRRKRPSIPRIRRCTRWSRCSTGRRRSRTRR